MTFTPQRSLIFMALLTLAMWASQATSRTLHEVSMIERHEQWIAHHGRTYKDSAEKEMRFKIFKNNSRFIESFNSAGNRPYKLKINRFADQTNDEFRASHSSGFKRSFNNKPSQMTPFRYENLNEVPSSLDWREKGAVTPVKYQGRCGCCWAFSAVAAVEGITQIATGKLISLSEQELVDCDNNSGENRGCGGGFMDKAFKFIVQNKGLTTEAEYPYEGVNGICNVNEETSHVSQITGYENVPVNNEIALMNAVANQPVSVAIDASGHVMQFYSGGVLTEGCGTKLNHGVIAVGYGTTDDGTKYWLVKNSWGTQWGEDGYIRIERDIDDVKGLCGIAGSASYPTIA